MSEDMVIVSLLMKIKITPVMKKAIYNLNVVIAFVTILTSCTKEEGVSDGGSSPGRNPPVSKTGRLIINIIWSLPQPTLACFYMASVDVEFQGPTSNFSTTYRESPVKVDERLPIGKYTYTITKRPFAGCSNFSPIIKTGTFSINSCPTICVDATSLKFRLD